MADSTDTSVVEGVLDKVVFSNEENAWSVVRVTIPGKREPVTAVGNLLGVQPGESLRLHGTWTDDKRYGEQFKVTTYVTVQPSTLGGIEKYLSSGMIKGVGATIAKRLVKHFGLDTLDVLDNHPERLTEVEGIGPVRLKRFAVAWAEQRHVKEVMVFLQSHGISATYATRIYKAYGDRAVAIVKNNPYRLAEDIFGIGFRSADAIGANLGIAKDSPQRAEAGVVFTLNEMASAGHCYAPKTELTASASEMLAIDAAIVETALRTLTENTKTIVEGTDGGDAGARVYLADLHAAEVEAAACLNALLETPPTPISIDPDRAVAWFESSQGIELASQQREALRRAVHSKVLVITGGPGTGKTTIVNGVIRILEKKLRRILLCAPTGRAAKRINETTGRDACTIHRLLEFSPKQGTFERNRAKPLEADVLIVDETSMLDIRLLCDVLRAVPPRCQLILVGDVDQLPSVGPGAVLSDLIRSGAVDVVTLTEIFRQSEASHIVLNAHRINAGEMPELGGDNPSGDKSDFYVIERNEPERVLETIKEVVARRIPRQFGLSPMTDIQILTPMHRGTLGAGNLNAELQALLNPDGDTLTRGARTFRTGDKVMQVRNNYDLNVFNGDIGQLLEVVPEDRTAVVSFEGREVTYEASDLDELVLAYACTIHKSQGSEYPAVVLPVSTQHYAMLQRNLLYTGITRGKRLVVLVGSMKAIGIAIRNDRVAQRYTRLAERLAAPAPGSLGLVGPS